MSEDPKQDPPPQQDPTHDVPVYPEQDPPAETQQPIKAASAELQRGLAPASRALARPVGAYPRGSAAHLRIGSPQEGRSERERHKEGHSQGDAPKEGEEDVDEDDLDPQVPHSPPDANKNRIVFDENNVAG